MIQLLKPNYPSLQELVRDLRTIESQGWREDAASVTGSIWRTGAGVPSNTLGANGDLYLDTLTANVYQKASGVYALITNIKGAPGDSNPYVATPTSPNAFDDEFNSGSPDLAVRGYTIINASTGATLTRAGDIDPWNTTGPVGNTYWSTLRNSWIYIQGAPGMQIDFYKAISLSAGDTYFMRMGGSFGLTTAAAGRYNETGLYGASGAGFDNNNRVFCTMRDDTSTTLFMMYDAARITGGASSAATGRAALGGHDIHGVHFTSGTSHTLFFLGSNSGEVLSLSVTGAPAAGTLTRWGARNLFSTSGMVPPQIWSIDFIRKKAGNAWLIP